MLETKVEIPGSELALKHTAKQLDLMEAKFKSYDENKDYANI